MARLKETVMKTERKFKLVRLGDAKRLTKANVGGLPETGFIGLPIG